MREFEDTATEERTDALIADLIDTALTADGHGDCDGWTMQDGRVQCACGGIAYQFGRAAA